ncbi:MAG: hypothetical protein HC810_07315 [Acaryochloridaceae cyanobacterium RL_2_7]|nr:hypothetical protein [Acaryochloridaceae cyanobacterium RL_2_7]
MLWDDSVQQGFPGIWWEHYKEDVPSGRCHVICEIDFNNFKRQYEIRILEVEDSEDSALEDPPELPRSSIEILDFRGMAQEDMMIPSGALVVSQCPKNWDELGRWVQRSRLTQRPLVLTYSVQVPSVSETFASFFGLVKWALEQDNCLQRSAILQQLEISDRTLSQGLLLLPSLGVTVHAPEAGALKFSGHLPEESLEMDMIQDFLQRIQEERFQRQFFQQLKVSRIQTLGQINGMSD